MCIRDRSYLKYEEDFAFLRRALEEGYFEQLVREAFLENGHLAEVEAVSYTHLDVYKRQVQGDLGTSYYTHQPVTQEIAARFPATAELAICAIIVAALVGVALGVLAAVKQNQAAANVSMVVALVGVSMPIFWSGILLILLFAGILHVLPSSGRVSPLMQPYGGTGFFIIDTIMKGDMAALGDVLVHLILPTLALSLYSMAIITRMTRSSMLLSLIHI